MDKNDLDLQRDIIDELSWDPAVNADSISVEVDKGIVSLIGHVASFREKTHAAQAVQRIVGAKGLINALSTSISPKEMQTDADIAIAARHTLDYLVPEINDTIRIMVDQGIVTISGEVDWAYQKWEVEAAIGRLRGIANVHSNVTVRPHPSSIINKTDIEVACRRATDGNCSNIKLTIVGTVVILSGEVRSWAERTALTSAASRSPGITEVIDETTIV